MPNKIGLLGGTFNPIHLGHIELGLKVVRAFDLDRVLYILSANPPHKDSAGLVGAELRLTMIQEALKPFPELEPCDIEMKRTDPSWTVQTVALLRQRYPNDNFYFISGSEGFLKIRTWKNYRTLLSSVFFIVVLRKPAHRRKLEMLLSQENIPFQRSPLAGLEPPCVFFYVYRSDRLDLSSTEIRRRARQSRSIEDLIPAGVAKYIREHNLYGY